MMWHDAPTHIDAIIAITEYVHREQHLTTWGPGWRTCPDLLCRNVLELVRLDLAQRGVVDRAVW